MALDGAKGAACILRRRGCWKRAAWERRPSRIVTDPLGKPLAYSRGEKSARSCSTNATPWHPRCWPLQRVVSRSPEAHPRLVRRPVRDLHRRDPVQGLVPPGGQLRAHRGHRGRGETAQQRGLRSAALRWHAGDPARCALRGTADPQARQASGAQRANRKGSRVPWNPLSSECGRCQGPEHLSHAPEVRAARHRAAQFEFRQA